MKRTKDKVLTYFLLLTMMLAPLGTVQASAENLNNRYISAVKAKTTIIVATNGSMTGSFSVTLKNGYHADTTLTIYQDNRAIKSWSDTASGSFKMEKVYMLTSGHTYMVCGEAQVYNSSNQPVETIIECSDAVAY